MFQSNSYGYFTRNLKIKFNLFLIDIFNNLNFSTVFRTLVIFIGWIYINELYYLENLLRQIRLGIELFKFRLHSGIYYFFVELISRASPRQKVTCLILMNIKLTGDRSSIA